MNAMPVARHIAAVMISLFALGAIAQPAAPLHFEVASIKPAAELSGVRGGCHGIDTSYTPGEKDGAPPLGRCVITSARLSHLVDIAWGVGPMSFIESGPEWVAMGAERFDVVAKAENPAKTTEKQLLEMLQNLLVERFQMKYHRKPAEESGFALTIARGGPKLEESKSQDSDLKLASGGKPSPGQPTTVRAHRCSMEMLVSYLSTFGGNGPGIDKTGLTGFYDFTLSWDESTSLSLAAALKSQLGLQMESQKVPVSYFVIDSAKRPAAN